MLPKDAILVGQNISKDVEWLGLKYGQDFQELKDLTGLFRVLNPKYNSYSVFSQDHLVKTLLNWDVSGNHDAVGYVCESSCTFVTQFLQTFSIFPA
jgi:RNA exonuclease 4